MWPSRRKRPALPQAGCRKWVVTMLPISRRLPTCTSSAVTNPHTAVSSVSVAHQMQVIVARVPTATRLIDVALERDRRFGRLSRPDVDRPLVDPILGALRGHEPIGPGRHVGFVAAIDVEHLPVRVRPDESRRRPQQPGVVRVAVHQQRPVRRQRRASGGVIQAQTGRHRSVGLRVPDLETQRADRGGRQGASAAHDHQIAERDAAARANGQVGSQDPLAGESRSVHVDGDLAQFGARLRPHQLRHAVAVPRVLVPGHGERLGELRRVHHRQIDRLIDVERVPVVDVEREQVPEQTGPSANGLQRRRNLAAIDAELRPVDVEDSRDAILRPCQRHHPARLSAVRPQLVNPTDRRQAQDGETGARDGAPPFPRPLRFRHLHDSSPLGEPGVRHCGLKVGCRSTAYRPGPVSTFYRNRFFRSIGPTSAAIRSHLGRTRFRHGNDSTSKTTSAALGMVIARVVYLQRVPLEQALRRRLA